jgi:DNA-binding XRE family transcriptional regulator
MSEVTLTQARLSQRLTQAQLAKIAGVATWTVAVIENSELKNGSQVHITTATLLAGALGVSVRSISWPNGLTDRGKPAGTTDSPTSQSNRTASLAVCQRCHMQLPLSGQCETCG